MRTLILTIASVLCLHQLQAQGISAGLRTGISGWTHFHERTYISQESVWRKYIWDNEVFARYELKKFAFEGSYGNYSINDYDRIYRESYKSQYISSSFRERYHQYTVSAQYRIYQNRSQKLKAYTGLSLSITDRIYQGKTTYLDKTTNEVKTDVRRHNYGGSGYIGFNLLLSYKLSNHIYANSLMSIRSNSRSVSSEYWQNGFPSPPDVKLSWLVGLSYKL